MIVVCSPGLARLPYLESFLGIPVLPRVKRRGALPRFLPSASPGAWLSARQPLPEAVCAVAGWGMKTTRFHAQAQQLAQQHGLPYWRLEDGFLRSFGTAAHFPSVSLIVDRQGIYYNSHQPNELEAHLQSNTNLLAGREAEVKRAMQEIVQYGLSKYNHGGPLPPAISARLQEHAEHTNGPRILVVDQTRNDLSVEGGGANAATFATMLNAAYAAHPNALVIIKTHPEVSDGSKAGYLSAQLTAHRMPASMQASNVPAASDSNATAARTLTLTENVDPYELLQCVDEVYVVSSQLGFEALLAGKKVRCFGTPWYAGWGATEQEQLHPRRTRERTVTELFAAAYIDYTRYIDPDTGAPGNIFHAIEWLKRQKAHARQFPGRTIAVGFKRWRQYNIKDTLSLHPQRLHFVPNVQKAAALQPREGDHLLFWGATLPKNAETLTQQGAQILHMEDGFIRSVGLGSDRIRPLSFVFDPDGLYFNPNSASRLENILLHTEFTDEDRERAAKIIALMVEHRLTKYNLEDHTPPAWAPASTAMLSPANGAPGQRTPRPNNRLVILVPGQVSDDASVRLGSETVDSNLALLEAVRDAHPHAFIVYKPHPDVISGNRKGRIALREAEKWADVVETQASIISCIEACDVVHTLTSLSGFDAMLRGKNVTTYGRPFYAGWGLTTDRLPRKRPRRHLTLLELVAGALLYYPVYWNWPMRGVTTCEATLHTLWRERMEREQNGTLSELQRGAWPRFQRKAKAYIGGWRWAKQQWF